MAMNIGLTGIDASQFQLDVTANNVANAASYGFKRSRSEFADIYSSGVYQKIDLTVGNGVKTVAASQQFVQGSTKKTTSVLDLALQGSGYFVTSSAPEVKDFKYTRAGAYKLNKDNFIVNSHDEYLMAYPVNKHGKTVSLSMMTSQAVQVPTGIGSPERTENLELVLNLPVITDASQCKQIANFNPDNDSTYNFSTASVVYDSLGSQHVLKSYYLKPGVERQLWNTKLNKVDHSFSKTMVDCSQVFDPGGELERTNAWAVFYTLDDKPIQPMNKQQNDVEGFAYQAKNVEYTNSEDSYPDLITANEAGTGAELYIDIDNTQIGTGCLYPGKKASTPPEGVEVSPGPPPIYKPDNYATALSDDHLHIVNGDKNNEARPRDFWRCQFLFSGSGKEVSKPTEPVYLQPAGFVGQAAGETPQTAYGNNIKYRDFQPPRQGEVARITHSFEVMDQSTLTSQAIKFEFDITEAEQNAKQLSDVIAAEFSAFMQDSNSLDTSMSNQQFFEAIGTQIDFDPIRAELRVRSASDAAQRTDYVFEQVGTEVTSVDPGEPVSKNEVVTSFGVNISKFLQEIPDGSISGAIVDETMWVGLQIGNAVMHPDGTDVIQQSYGNLTTMSSSISHPTPSIFLATHPLKASETSTTEDFLNKWVQALNACLTHMYNPQTEQSGSTSSPIPPTAQTLDKTMRFSVNASQTGFDLISSDVFMNQSGYDVSFALYPSAGTNVNAKPGGGYIPSAAPIHTSNAPTDASELSMNSLALDLSYAGKTIYSIEHGLDANNRSALGATFDYDAGYPLNNLTVDATLPTPEYLGAVSSSDPVNFLAAQPEGSRCTLSFFDDNTSAIQPPIKLDAGLNPPNLESASGKADLYGLDSGTKEFEYLDNWGTNPLSMTNTLDAAAQNVLLPSTPVMVSTQNHTSLYMDGNVVASSQDLGAEALPGIAEQDQVIRIKYSGNTSYDAPFQVLLADADGYSVGSLTGLDIDSSGLISAAFTNGQKQYLGRVALARFNNEHGLLKVGNTAWEESMTSGKAIPGEGKTATFGNIDAGSLELSNVNLSNELVDLIIGQRNYQANARSIEVEGVIHDSILQIN